MPDFTLLPAAYILTLFPALMIIAAVGDVISMKIPNRLVIILALGFFPGALMIGMPLSDIGIHVLVAAGLYIAGFIMFLLRIAGGGDLKLLSAVALWLGPSHLLSLILLTAIAGIFVVAFVFLVRQYPIPLRLQKHFEFFNIIAGDCKYVPYGIAICIGALMTYSQTVWVEALGNLPLV